MGFIADVERGKSVVQIAEWNVIVLLVSTGLCAQYRPQNLKWVATVVTPIPPTLIIVSLI